MSPSASSTTTSGKSPAKVALVTGATRGVGKGIAVPALHGDPSVVRRTGQVVVAAELGTEYGFTDIDGKQPRPLRLADL